VTLYRSLLDTWLVARFEVLRSVRTWRAMALLIAYLIANLGGIYLFIEGLAAIEQEIAAGMGVQATRWPGTLSGQLLTSDSVRKMVAFLVADEALVDDVLGWPLLAIFQLWLGLIFIPYLVATTASEAIATDVQSGAIRYEALRTGRAELVVGRLLGQGLLSLGALAVTMTCAWAMGMLLMVGQDPLALAWGMAALGGRAIFFALPFAGLGIACSQLTTSPAWARVMALAGAAGSWMVYAALNVPWDPPWSYLADAIMPLLPQTWLLDLWRPDGWWVAALVHACLGLLMVGLGYVRFAGRDL
jgi:hypothetical protein